MNTRQWLDRLLSAGSKINVERFGLSRVAGDWRLSDRRIPEHYLCYILSESARVSLAGQSWSLKEGALIYVAPGIAHSLSPLSPEKPHTFYHLRFTLHEQKISISPTQKWKVLENARFLQPFIEQLFDEYHHKQKYSQQRLHAILGSIFSALLRNTPKINQREERKLPPQQQRQCLNYVLDNISNPIAPQNLARLTGYCHDYFTRIFRHSMGCAPRTWIMQQRIKQAMFLLESSNLPVSTIALEVGCEDVFRFSKQFKQINGKSPKNYRRAITGPKHR